MNNYDYPMGADTSSAPWNQKDNPEMEIEVTVSVTLSKSFSIRVKDYKVIEEESEDGVDFHYDFSDCDLINAVNEQVTLPQDLALCTERIFDHDLDLKRAKMPLCLKEAIEDGKYWNVDDMDVIIE